VSTVGVRELKNNLSYYVRRVEKGERVAVTAHGRVVAELCPPGAADALGGPPARLATLIRAGVLRPALESGDPLSGLENLSLPRGTAARLLEADRDAT
jgi:prevent-host-death family protein